MYKNATQQCGQQEEPANQDRKSYFAEAATAFSKLREKDKKREMV